MLLQSKCSSNVLYCTLVWVACLGDKQEFPTNWQYTTRHLQHHGIAADVRSSTRISSVLPAPPLVLRTMHQRQGHVAPKDCDHESCNAKICSPISLDMDVAISSALIIAVSPSEASCSKTSWILSGPLSRSSHILSARLCFKVLWGCSLSLIHLSHVFLPKDRCSTSHDYQDLTSNPGVDFESWFQHKDLLSFHTKSNWVETEAGSHRSRPEGDHWMTTPSE